MRTNFAFLFVVGNNACLELAGLRDNQAIINVYPAGSFYFVANLGDSMICTNSAGLDPLLNLPTRPQAQLCEVFLNSLTQSNF